MTDLAMPNPVESVRPTAESARPAAHRSEWRADIQALRGLAVVLVVAEHMRLPLLPGGFLGVDIFFVISGFLMTRIILSDLHRCDFSFRTFYARRARRLLPAVYATIAVTAAAAPFLLDALEFRNFVAQVAGAFTFTVNAVLWGQADYFGSGAALKPLLHLWSLSVEEQYYIVIPLVLFLLPAGWRLPANVVAVIASLIACMVFVGRSPSAAFYFLPFRAWELGIGSLMAFAAMRGFSLPQLPILRGLAAVTLIALPMAIDQRGHPGAAALAVCVATALLLLPGASAVLPRALRPLGWVGDRSYSLYLVHWPILAFANNVFLGKVPLWVNILLLLPMLVWMELQYRLVEQRWRSMTLTPRAIAALVVLPAGLCAALAGWAMTLRPSDTEKFGFGAACVARTQIVDSALCRNADAPKAIVWGDSFSLHLIPGLAATMPGGIVQAGKPVCGPFLDLAPTDGGQHSRDWAAGCRTFNASVLAYIDAHPEIERVVLTSALAQFVPGGEATPWQAIDWSGAISETADADLERLERGLERTVQALRARGRKVVVVAPPPAIDSDVGRCLRRLEQGLWIVPGSDCRFERASYESYREPIRAFLAQVERAGFVDIIRFDDTLCGSGTCETAIDGVPLYADATHLSADGSRLLAVRMKLADAIERQAR